MVVIKPLLSSLTAPSELISAAAGLGHDHDLIAAAPAASSSSEGLCTRQIVLFVLTYVAYVAIYFARKPVSVCKSTLESELGLTRAALGGVDTALLTMYAIGQFMVGAIASVFGRTVPLVSAYVVCGIATAAFGFASSARTMSLLWGVSGFFAASVHPFLVLFLTDLFPPSLRATAIGLWQTSQQIGGVAANTAASAVLASRGWRAVFKSSGVVVAAMAPVLAGCLLLGGPKAAPKVKAAPKAAEAKSGAAGQPPSALTLPGVRSVGAAYTLVKMARYCLMFWLPYFLSKQVGMDAAAAAVMAAVFDVAGVLGSISTGVLCDTFFGGKMIATTVPFILVSAAAFALWGVICLAEKAGGTSLRSLHIGAMALVGFAIASPDGVLGGAAARNLCDYAGADMALAATAAGVINGCGSVGAILQGGLTAQLVDAVGWSGLYFTLAAALVLTAAVLVPAVAVEARAMEQGKR